jgi:hypothetical protein
MIDDNDTVQIGHLLRAFARYIDNRAEKFGATNVEIMGKIVNPLCNLAGHCHA